MNPSVISPTQIRNLMIETLMKFDHITEINKLSIAQKFEKLTDEQLMSIGELVIENNIIKEEKLEKMDRFILALIDRMNDANIPNDIQINVIDGLKDAIESGTVLIENK